MNESVIIYLRKKGEPLLERKRNPDYSELRSKSLEERDAIKDEVEAYNKKVIASYGCKLLVYKTNPSTGFGALKRTEKPQSISVEDMDKVTSYFDEEMKETQRKIKWRKTKVQRLEERISKTKLELYDKINSEIDLHFYFLDSDQKDLEELQFHQSQFALVKNIMEDHKNFERYELVYTHC